MIIAPFGLFIFIAGLIIGLGAVTVIDLHGFMGRKSEYWTEATTRTHKITKPLIWIGTTATLIGSIISYSLLGFNTLTTIHFLIMAVLILNGIFLSFSVSPFLIHREAVGKSREILPKKWQVKITVSFIFSFVGWWSVVLIFVSQIIQNLVF